MRKYNMSLKIDDSNIRKIIREEIIKKDNPQIIKEVDDVDDIDAVDGFDDADDDDLDSLDPVRQAEPDPVSNKGGGCKRPAVGDMQRIFMGTGGGAEEAATTPNLKYKDDCIWGRYTQAAWIKFLKHYLKSADFILVGERDGVKVEWYPIGSSAATSDIDMPDEKSYQGTAAGALSFVKDLITRGTEPASVPEPEPEPEPEPAVDPAVEPENTVPMEMDVDDSQESGTDELGAETGGSDFIAIPVQDNEGQLAFTIFVPARSISTDAADRYRDGIAGWMLDDFIIDFTQGSTRTRGGIPLLTPLIDAVRGGPKKKRSSVTQGMDDKFIISWGQYPGMTADPTATSASVYSNIEYPFSSVQGLRFEDTFPWKQVPDDDPFKQVARCLAREKKVAERAKGTLQADWEASPLGGALLSKITAKSNKSNYQRLIITLTDGTERTLIRPHPRNAAIKDSATRNLLDMKFSQCSSSTVRGGRSGGAKKTDPGSLSWLKTNK